MKKLICKVALCLSILAMGTVFTSCDKDTIETILNYLTGGESYTYSGTYTLQAYALNSETGNLAPATEKMEYEGTSVVATAKKATTFTAAGVDLTLPGTEIVEGITMSDVKITNLTLDETTLEVGSNTSATGTLTYTANGNTQTFNIYDITINASISTELLQLNDCIVYFGDEGDYAVRITMVDGKIAN